MEAKSPGAGAREKPGGAAVALGLTVPVALILVASLVATVFILILASGAENTAVLHASERIADGFFQGRQQLLQRVLRDHVRWNEEAEENLSVHFNPGWAAANLGTDFAATHDLAYVIVLGGDDRIIFATQQGEPVPQLDIRRFGPALRVLAAQARTARTAGDEPPAIPLAVEGEAPHFAAASRLSTATPGRADRSVIVITRRLDTARLRQITSELGLRNLRFETHQHEGGNVGRHVLTGIAGAPVGALVWDVDEPGDRLLFRVLPAIAGAHAAIALLLWLFVARARGVAARVTRDRQELARQDAALAAGEDRFRAVVENAGEGIVFIDEAGAIEDANPAAERLLAADGSSIVGKRFADILAGAPSDADADAEDTRTHRLKSPPSHSKFVEVEAMFVRLGDPGSSRRIALLRDITGLNHAAELVDLLASAMIVTDKAGRLKFANRRGEQLLAAGDAIALRDGQVVAYREQDGLGAAIAAAGSADLGTSAFVRLHGPSGDASLQVHICPLGTPDRERSVALLCRAPDFRPAIPAAALTSAFGLTPAEARVVSGLVSGQSLKEVAERHSLSANTVRNQLAQAFQKTGTTRQADLVALVVSQVGTTV